MPAVALFVSAAPARCCASPPSFPAEGHGHLTPLPSGAGSRLYLSSTSLSGHVLKVRALRCWDDHITHEYEASVLRSLSHPSLPLLHSSFTAEWDGALHLVLVFHNFRGAPLSHHLRAHTRFSAALVRHLLVQLLDLLIYLSALSPPLAHGNLSPDTVLLCVHEHEPSPVYVLDFVPAHTPHDDLVAVGSLVLELLVGRPQHLWSVREGTVQVMQMLGERPTEVRVLAAVVDALVNGYVRAPQHALRLLQQGGNVQDIRAAPLVTSFGRVTVCREDAGQTLVLRVRGRGFSEHTVVKSAFVVAWLGITGLWTIGAGPLWGWFSAPFWLAGWNMTREVKESATDALFRVEKGKWSIGNVEGLVSDLVQVVNTQQGVVLEGEKGEQGRIGGLDPEECIWVCKQLKHYFFSSASSGRVEE